MSIAERLVNMKKLERDLLDGLDTAKLKARRAVTKVAPKSDPLVWNPLMKYDRNGLCLCGSGRKFKKCCGPHQAARIPRSEAQDILRIMRELGSAIETIREANQESTES